MERDEEETFARCRAVGDFFHSVGKSRISSLPKINLRASAAVHESVPGTFRT